MGADTAPIGAKSDHYGKKSRHAQLRFAANSVTIAIDDLFSVALGRVNTIFASAAVVFSMHG